MCHLLRVVSLNDADGPLAQQLSGIDPFVSCGDVFPISKVQRTAAQVQRAALITAEVSEVILTTCQVTCGTQRVINTLKTALKTLKAQSCMVIYPVILYMFIISLYIVRWQKNQRILNIYYIFIIILCKLHIHCPLQTLLAKFTRNVAVCFEVCYDTEFLSFVKI